jgi:hypothetical protein
MHVCVGALATEKQTQVTLPFFRLQTPFRNVGFNLILTGLSTLEDLSAYISYVSYKSYKMKRICEPVFNSLQVFRQCHLTSKAPCFYRNRRHGSSFPIRRVRCSVVQLMAPRHPRFAGWIRQIKSSLTCPVSGKYPTYTSQEA